MYDDIKSEQTTTNSLAYDLQSQVEQLQKDQGELLNRVTGAESSIVDPQCRSMRDNLIFTGIDEPNLLPDETEDTEKSLYDFLPKEMNIYEKIPFHRIHRIGPRERENDDPRPIVAKFKRYEDREFVRLKAPQSLRGKSYGVREQFPKVIEDQRKRLYPEAKRARENKQNKVRLVRDRLFINGAEIVPPPKKDSQQKQGQGDRIQGGGRSYSTQGQWHRGKPTYTSRVFQRSSKPAYGAIAKPSNFSMSTYNRFDKLADENSNTSYKDRSKSQKIRARSPLDSDQTLKKHRENQSESEDENLGNSFQSESSSQNLIDLTSGQVEPQSHDEIVVQSHDETVETPAPMDTQANGDSATDVSHDVPRDDQPGQ